MEQLIAEIIVHLSQTGREINQYFVHQLKEEKPSSRFNIFVTIACYNNVVDQYETIVAGLNTKLSCYTLFAQID